MSPAPHPLHRSGQSLSLIPLLVASDTWEFKCWRRVLNVMYLVAGHLIVFWVCSANWVQFSPSRPQTTQRTPCGWLGWGIEWMGDCMSPGGLIGRVGWWWGNAKQSETVDYRLITLSRPPAPLVSQWLNVCFIHLSHHIHRKQLQFAQSEMQQPEEIDMDGLDVWYNLVIGHSGWGYHMEYFEVAQYILFLIQFIYIQTNLLRLNCTLSIQL